MVLPDAFDETFAPLRDLGLGDRCGCAQPGHPDLRDRRGDRHRPRRHRRDRGELAASADALRADRFYRAAPVLAAWPHAPARWRAGAYAPAGRRTARPRLRAEIDELTHRRGGFQRREAIVDLVEPDPAGEQVVGLQ